CEQRRAMNIHYLCYDLGIPVLGRKGGSVHLRSLVTAFVRAGHSMVLATPLLNKSPWEGPAKLDVSLLHLPPSADIVNAVLALKAFTEMLGVANPLPGELRRILYNQEIATPIKRRFEHDPPDFIYERASLYSTAAVALSRELNVPLLVELNALLAAEHSAFRPTAMRILARRGGTSNIAGASGPALPGPASRHCMRWTPARRARACPEGTRAHTERCVHGVAAARGGRGFDPAVRRGSRSLSSTRPRFLFLATEAVRIHGLWDPRGRGRAGADRRSSAGWRDGPALSAGRTGRADRGL